MNDYRVYINVTASAGRWVTVTAADEADAAALVEEMVENNDVDLDWEHYNIGCDRVERIAQQPHESED